SRLQSFRLQLRQDEAIDWRLTPGGVLHLRQRRPLYRLERPVLRRRPWRMLTRNGRSPGARGGYPSLRCIRGPRRLSRLRPASTGRTWFSKNSACSAVAGAGGSTPPSASAAAHGSATSAPAMMPVHFIRLLSLLREWKFASRMPDMETPAGVRQLRRPAAAPY